MSSDGVHVSVKAIEDIQTASERFATALIEHLPEIKREIVQVSDLLEERRDQLIRDIERINDQMLSDDDDDTQRYRHRIEEMEDELAVIRRRIRKFDDVRREYERHARNAEHIATDHVFRMREFLSGVMDDVKSLLSHQLEDTYATFGGRISGQTSSASEHSSPVIDDEASAREELERLEAEHPEAHFFSRHGAHTTLEQQYIRATTGLAPDGVRKKPSDSTRFLTHRGQLAAAIEAQKIYMCNENHVGHFSFIMSEIIGEGYQEGGGCVIQTACVAASFRNGKLTGLHPLLPK